MQKEVLEKSQLGKVGEGGGFGVEGRDGFDQARDGEGVADASWTANQAQVTAFPRELDGDANQRREAGAVDLRSPVEDDDDVARTPLYGGLQGAVKLFGGLADGEPAVNLENGNCTGFANVDFHGQPFRHKHRLTAAWHVAVITRWAAQHYTLARQMHKSWREVASPKL